MSLAEYLNRMNKEECTECEFSIRGELKSRPIVRIPPPESPRIMLISRDPTKDFLPLYQYSKHYLSNERRRILFVSAIPQSLIVQIMRFLRREDEELERNVKELYRMLDVAYWTHLHKCPTDREHKFSIICADKWLREEINKAIEDGIQTIVCLGRDVENWIDTYVGIPATVEVIRLPHPSGANRKWYMMDTEEKHKTREGIERLMKACQES